MESTEHRRPPSILVPFIGTSGTGEVTGTDSRLVVSKDWGWRVWDVTVNPYSVSFGDGENVLKCSKIRQW